MARPKPAEVVAKPPKLSPAQAVTRLEGLRERVLKAVEQGLRTDHENEELHYEAQGVLEDALGENDEGVQRILSAGIHSAIDVSGDVEHIYTSAWKLRAKLIGNLVERLRSNISVAPQPAAPAVVRPTALEQVERLLKRFHRAALQLRKRHGARPAHVITDEYDVQDLLHALLKLHFDDVRPEEVSPSYAGKSSRMDFLLKAEQLVVEVKMTRDSLGEKDVGGQLIEDIARYAKHPDCKTLVCFVYDPEHHIGNPDGIEHDLSGTRDGLPVKVFIAPRS